MAKSDIVQSRGSQDVVTVDLRPLLMPGAIVLASIIIGVSLIASASSLRGGVVVGTGTTSSTGTVAQPDTGVPSAQPTTGTTTIAGDPTVGNANTAKVAVVEFSDFRCSFCKRFFDDTLGQLKSEYVNSGDVVFVYKHFPVLGSSAHANAASCAGAQGGDTAFFKMHDALFPVAAELTTSADFARVASGIGLNGDELAKCVDEARFASQISAHEQSAQALQIDGTPGFVVGIINEDGTVTGDIIRGAYPYDTFKQAIDKYLSQ